MLFWCCLPLIWVCDNFLWKSKARVLLRGLAVSWEWVGFVLHFLLHSHLLFLLVRSFITTWTAAIRFGISLCRTRRLLGICRDSSAVWMCSVWSVPSWKLITAMAKKLLSLSQVWRHADLFCEYPSIKTFLSWLVT